MKKLECLRVPQLRISLATWQKMMAYIINCPTEINGFGIIEQVHQDLLIVRDVFITEQIAGPAHVEIEPLVLGNMMTDMIRRGENPGNIKFQWHSHVHMPAYFSGTDLENIENWSGDWLISVVANKMGEYSCRLDILSGVRIGVELKPEIVAFIDDEIMAVTAREIGQKVKRATPILQRPKAVTTGKPVSSLIGLGEPEAVMHVSGDRP